MVCLVNLFWKLCCYCSSERERERERGYLALIIFHIDKRVYNLRKLLSTKLSKYNVVCLTDEIRFS